VTIVTHFLATTLGVQAMGLEGRERVLAYAFGMGVDIDHAVKYRSTCGQSGPPGQTRLLLAILAAGAGGAALDRAVVRVSRNAAADPVLLDSCGDGLQYPFRRRCRSTVLSMGHARVADEHPRQGEGGIVFVLLLAANLAFYWLHHRV